jgi:hypothetical protein
MFEQGPIRPPSEAGSMLVRVSRNCPWNRCAFCPVYKGANFSLRTADEVLNDLEEMKAWYGGSPQTVFLQDADPLATKTEDLLRILAGIQERFPTVHRITAYARAHTLTRRSLEELVQLRRSGLDRLHVGLESGSQEVLDLVSKGAGREQQIKAGVRAKEAGFELSEYVMPGLGGKQLTQVHARETASALLTIHPDFVRLRTTVVVPGSPLAVLEEQGSFNELSEAGMVEEIRHLLVGIRDLRCRVESDHSLNLLIELRGNLPRESDRLIDLCDRFLAMTPDDQAAFIIARRTNRITRLSQLENSAVRHEMGTILDHLAAKGISVENAAAQLRMGMV